MVEPDRQQMTTDVISCMCFAPWMTKATNTLSEYVKLTDFPLRQWLLKFSSFLRFMYIACLVLDPRANSKLVLNFFSCNIQNLTSSFCLSVNIQQSSKFRITKIS